MEEKESTVSGSLGNSDTDSPPPVSSTVMPQQVMSMNMNMNMNMNMAAEGMAMERNISAIPTTAAPPAVAGGGGSGGGGGGMGSAGSGELFVKKKRGRPRKYDSDGNLRVQPFHHHHHHALVPVSPALPQAFTLTPSSPPPPASGDHRSFSSSKRGRGRPAGSGNWQLLASLGEIFSNTAGGDFTPHVVTVNTGEDVAGKIMSFTQKGARGICILSANGAVSNVTIRQPGSSGGILTYEGRFEILSLTGSYTVSDGTRNRTGGLSISLAGPDGRVIGGGIAGLLLAASPIQIVVGSFMPSGHKVQRRKYHREQTMASSVTPAVPDAVTSAKPMAESKPDGETCLSPTSSLPGQNQGGTDNIASGKQVLHAENIDSLNWNGTERSSDQRPSPDINISVSSEDDVQGIF